MKFNINDYKGNYVMHCKTEREAKDFCNYLHSVGRKWCNGETYLDNTNFYIRRERTAYNFNEGSSCSVGWYEGEYTILEWSDFMNKEFTKEDLKTGDVVKFGGGDLGIVISDLEVIAVQNGGWIDFDSIKDDLTNVFIIKKYDIVAVRRPHEKPFCRFNAFKDGVGTLVYERKEPEEMTLSEVCKLLGKEIKIIPEKS